MRYLLVLLGLMVANVANAVDCQTVPSCEELGYTKNEEAGCLTDGYISCPFDTSYRKCVQYDCAKLGFTESDKTSWCASIISCKSDSAMTLCQKPCLATTYDELKDLAGSGKCKLLTIKNDITLPQNQGITLHADTIIDGGNHALNSSGNQGFDVYTLNNNTGFKNIFIKHDQSQTQHNLHVFNALNASVTLQNTQILTKSDDEVNHTTPLFYGGTYEISGQFTADIQAKWHYALAWAALTFKNADINITVTGGSGDAFVGNTNFINSQGTVTTSGVSVVHKKTLTFENSKIHLKAVSIFWAAEGAEYGTILLKDNAEVKLTFKNLTSGDITASNTTDTLILNGVTYRPKQAGTTKLSEIGSSGNWQKQ